jgi:S-adenosylmethionine:tRNA ribosyltransferase-isomerase
MVLHFDRPIDDEWLNRFGHIPLPPYIKREDIEADSRRYQTVYASETGSAAAPTAGLHFTEELLSELEKAGMEKVFITLHVGLGTFMPVRTEIVEEHTMHEEAFYIGEEAAERIEKAKREKRKILAVGTTSLRSLESAWQDGSLRITKKKGQTSIFIYPGFKFRAVDQLFTNFHTPMSTLLMLVSAFAEADQIPDSGHLPGRDLILESYQEAIKEGYRFFSYGDAMLIR